MFTHSFKRSLFSFQNKNDSYFCASSPYPTVEIRDYILFLINYSWYKLY